MTLPCRIEVISNVARLSGATCGFSSSQITRISLPPWLSRVTADRSLIRATRRSNPECRRRKDSGLLRGACHRAALCADPLARNDNVGARLRIPAACSARVVQAVAPGKRQRAQGKPGAPNAPAASRANEGSTRVSTLQVRRNSGLPCATGYDFLRALPGVHDLLVTVARRSSSARLAPAQGCQDHTPSPSARCCSSARGSRAQHPIVHCIPRPTFRDDWP